LACLAIRGMDREGDKGSGTERGTELVAGHEDRSPGWIGMNRGHKPVYTTSQDGVRNVPL
jgi:hypothetical protein